MRRYPHLYEINAGLFLRRLSGKYQRSLTLATIPEEEWQSLAQQGFDSVWLMGVWQRSPGSRQQARLNPALRGEYDQVLPGWGEADITGSPYAIYCYRLEPTLGQPQELAQLKEKLHRLGLSLLVDFVPNHLASDHPWILSHPDRFVRGSEEDVRRHADWFFSPERGIYLAHGRDLYFPPWGDTVQVNFYSADMRQALIAELQRIAEVADGVRCDMAMLALNDIFQQVWGEIIEDYPRPATEFWAEAIGTIKQKQPDFLFLAEVYWGLEPKLQELGFDFTYDKPFYDQLRFAPSTDIRRHLMADIPYQQCLARFIENHDELRAVTAFGRERSLAAAVILATVPGLRLFHDGQLAGRRLRLPVQLAREPEEIADPEMKQFYDRLLAITNAPIFHQGDWQLRTASPVRPGDESQQNLLAWSWHDAAEYRIVVVNYSPNVAQGWLDLPPLLATIERIVFRDELTDTTFAPNPAQASNHGLYLDLSPYQAYILRTIPGFGG